MKINKFLTYSVLAGALALGACSKPESSAPTASTKQQASVEVVSSQAKGFTVGAMMSTNVVYVFFDTQCPHCGHLWEASMPLHKKVKFVWIPVGMINATSAAQGAAILTAADPGALMTEHEASLLAGKGGISASSSIAADIEQAIKKNTQLLNNFGAESVPFIVAKNQKTGQTVSQDGALSTAALANFLGLDPQ
ncbi:MAG: thioredoxin fold domain-containing protein [Rhodoferax sp.]|uniref:thioredoxin fold domain-containing protein n=1 Tax=Rhodoferax sp. TaxID=50421 RepID=UPI003019007F